MSWSNGNVQSKAIFEKGVIVLVGLQILAKIIGLKMTPLVLTDTLHYPNSEV